MSIPWVEKYRPSQINDIVLDDNNKLLIENIIKLNYFPNLLFHGPPGTGKTTTIINLIQSFLKTNNLRYNDSCFIHLNASDERGIDIVRNQITTFINSKNLFFHGLKFVILDEADYMTKVAQIQLKEIIQKYPETRFCIICNYLCKIESSLRNEFIKISFNSVPKNYILKFLENIVCQEKIKFSKEKLTTIYQCFQPDIRSMINYLQQNFDNNKLLLINNKDFESIIKLVNSKKDSCKPFINKVNNILDKYCLSESVFLQKFIMYIFEKKSELLNNSKFLDAIDNIYGNKNSCMIIEYFYFILIEYF